MGRVRVSHGTFHLPWTGRYCLMTKGIKAGFRILGLNGLHHGTMSFLQCYYLHRDVVGAITLLITATIGRIPKSLQRPSQPAGSRTRHHWYVSSRPRSWLRLRLAPIICRSVRAFSTSQKGGIR